MAISCKGQLTTHLVCVRDGGGLVSAAQLARGEVVLHQHDLGVQRPLPK